MNSEDKANKKQPWIANAIVTLLVLCAAVAVSVGLFASCSPRIIREVVEKEVVVKKDSIVWRDSLISVPVPLGKDQTIVSTKDTSNLETQVAKSIAFVDKSGRLHHSLENKRTTLVAPIKFPVHYLFNGVTTTKVETLTKIEYRDKPLSWWQKVKNDTFIWLLAWFVLSIVFIIFRIKKL